MKNNKTGLQMDEIEINNYVLKSKSFGRPGLSRSLSNLKNKDKFNKNGSGDPGQNEHPKPKKSLLHVVSLHETVDAP